MGCDIHANIEIRYGDDSEWFCRAINIGINRNYALFEKMAGVRGIEDNAISKPRGIPSDVDDMAYKTLCEVSCCDHSHSWLKLKEMKQAEHLCERDAFYVYMLELGKIS